MKLCRKCGHIFESRNCPACAKIYTANWRLKNPEKYRLSKKVSDAKYRASNAEKINKSSSEYRKNNPVKVREIKANWYRVNNEKARASIKKYQTSNPNWYRVAKQNRRARKIANGGTLSIGLTDKLLRLQKGKCACCREPLGNDYHMDHIMPLALGGANEDWNMQLLRAICNLKKSKRHPIEFMQSRGFLL